MSPRGFRRIVTSCSIALALLAGTLVSLAGPTVADSAPIATGPAPTEVRSAPTQTRAVPVVRVARLVGGLDIPWDVTWVGGVMLFDQRADGIWSRTPGAAPKRVTLSPAPRVFAESEAGMLGMVAHPQAATNRLFYTCMAIRTASNGPRDVEVWQWRLGATGTTATRVKVMITGLPLVTGRHSGCRLRFRSTRMLYVGTGDAAHGTNPQSLTSLGGKILRIRDDGVIPTSNPFYKRGGKARLIFNFGHRNVQGLAKRPGRDEMWSVEQGTSRDDEVNRVWSGRNYGWDPTPGYDESRPMTDKKRHPHANGAKWRSGKHTVATCGATFISGAAWGPWNGRLAVAMLKGEGVKLLTISKANKVVHTTNVLRGYGRIRTIQQGPGGALYFTTANGDDDGIYRVTRS
jgi:glucose/arabinose dehydrogenase